MVMRLPTITPTRLPLNKLLQTTTLRGFTGGWNVDDDDMNMLPRYSKRQNNCFSTADGNIKLRNGTLLFADTGSPIINFEYFVDSLVVVCSAGEIYRVRGDGTVTVLSTILWGPTDFVSFALFNGHLIMCNGIDKPLDLDGSFVLELLQDAATLTNINVPICKYVVAINRYLVMAGDPLEPDKLHISAKDAAGTWFGDPPPNNATRVEVGSVIGATTIRGLLPFRGKLIVMFAEGLVFGTIGTEDADANHTPSFDDGVLGYGSFSHRAGITYGDDALFMDLEGVPSIRRTVLSTSFKPERVSTLIDPEIKLALGDLSLGTLEDRVFSVHNKSDAQFFLFVPNSNELGTTTETRVFVYNRLADNAEAWNEFTGWNFTCGARSLHGNVFFGDSDGKIWLYTGERDYVDLSVTPIDEGVGINFDWELPWLDFGSRGNSKTTKYISFDTRGASEFICRMYVDNLLVGENDVDTPALSMQFSGGEQGAFGNEAQPYGGGRRTSNKKLFSWPCKFQLAKLRFSGTAEEGLEFIAITMHYLQGGINR
jgi:hypothetical protein